MPNNLPQLSSHSFNIEYIRKFLESPEFQNLTTFRLATNDDVIRGVSVRSSGEHDLRVYVGNDLENIPVSIQNHQTEGKIRSVNLKLDMGNNRTLSIGISIDKSPPMVTIFNYLDINNLIIALDLINSILITI